MENNNSIKIEGKIIVSEEKLRPCPRCGTISYTKLPNDLYKCNICYLDFTID